jgi:short-subunit dehydrogenase
MLQPVYLTKALLPMLLKRETVSTIVLTSSVISHVAAPGLGIYSSTKAAVATFTEALHYETKSKVDVMSWDCGSVSTKLNSFKVGCRTSTKTAVKGCLKDISRERRTFGCW